MNQKQLKAKQELIAMDMKEKDIKVGLFGEVGHKLQINVKVDKEFLKAFNGEKVIISNELINFKYHGFMDGVIMRFVDMYNIHIYKLASYVEEVAHNNAGKGIAKIYPVNDHESIVIAKRTNKKHGIQQGMILFRVKQGFNSVHIIPEMRAFKGHEVDDMFEELQMQGVDLIKTMGDKFLVEQES